MYTFLQLLCLSLSACVLARSPWTKIPIDCGFSPWTKWLGCGGFGTTERYRIITRQAANGGRQCPANALLRQEITCDEEEMTLEKTAERFTNTFLRGMDRKVENLVKEERRYVNKIPSRVKRQAGEGDGDPERGKGMTEPEVAVTVLPRDVLFLVDVSTSVERGVWENVKWGLVDIIAAVCNGVGPDVDQNNRFALWLYSSHPVKIFDFDDYLSVNLMRRKIVSTEFLGDGTCTTEAIKTIRDWFLRPPSETGARPRDPNRVRREVLILTDGHSNCVDDTADELVRASTALQQDQVTVFSLAIGATAGSGKREIESLVSKPVVDHLFSLKTFKDFNELVTQLMANPFSCAPLPFVGNKKK